MGDNTKACTVCSNCFSIDSFEYCSCDCDARLCKECSDTCEWLTHKQYNTKVGMYNEFSRRMRVYKRAVAEDPTRTDPKPVLGEHGFTQFTESDDGEVHLFCDDCMELDLIEAMSAEEAAVAFFSASSGSSYEAQVADSIRRMEKSKVAIAPTTTTTGVKRKSYTVACVRLKYGGVAVESIKSFHSEKRARVYQYDAHHVEMTKLKSKFGEEDKEQTETLPTTLEAIKKRHEEFDHILDNYDEALHIECTETYPPSDEESDDDQDK